MAGSSGDAGDTPVLRGETFALPSPTTGAEVVVVVVADVVDTLPTAFGSTPG